MKSWCNWVSWFLMGLPMLLILIGWVPIPDNVAVDFTGQGETDKRISRQEWMLSLACIMSQLILTRGILFMLLRPYTSQHRERFIVFYWLSACFVCALAGLYVAEAVSKEPIYRHTLPILMALGEAGLVYSIMPDHLPSRSAFLSLTEQQRRASMHVYTISRLLIIWVNIIVVFMMLCSPGSDRWQMGVTANLLICILILLMGAIASFYANQLN